MAREALDLGDTVHVRLPIMIDKHLRKEAYRQSIPLSTLLRSVVVTHFEDKLPQPAKSKKASKNADK